jgi:hypothetical protein
LGIKINFEWWGRVDAVGDAQVAKAWPIVVISHNPCKFL